MHLNGGTVEGKQRQFLDQVMAGTSRLQDIRTAGREGWTRITGGDGATVHLVNDRATQDGKVLDPSSPEALIYRKRGDSWTLVGAMFMSGQDGSIGSKDGLALKSHGHDGHPPDSTHVWFMPNDLPKAFGDRGDPPDELMDGLGWDNPQARAFREDPATFEALKRDFAAL